MIDISRGRYWDKPWSLVSSCTRVSPGCQNCWSLAMEKRFHRGEEGEIVVHPERLDIPLRTRKPTVFCVWNDLFHPMVSTLFIAGVFEKMMESDRHTFLVLTKRPEVVLNLMRSTTFDIRGLPRNLWLGVTAENQEQADKRIPILLQIPAAKRFVSIEPMLSKIDLEMLPHEYDGISGCYSALTGEWWPAVGDYRVEERNKIQTPKLDLVILGGETGPHARPMHPDWVRSVRDQCAAAGVPFFFKSWGEWAPWGGGARL